MKLPNQDSATGRGVKTAVQAFISALIVFSTGFIGVIQSVPGCSEAVVGFLQDNAVQYALLLGIPAGIVAFVMNFFRKDIKNY